MFLVTHKVFLPDGTEDRYSISRKDINSKYVLMIDDVEYEDRGKYFCCLPTNCSDSTEGGQQWTLRVKGMGSSESLKPPVLSPLDLNPEIAFQEH